MAHDTGDADIGDVHYDQGIPYGDPQGRTPQKPEGSVGVDIDNWLRSLFGGDPRTQAEGGKPTDVLGVLPQSPTLGAQPRPQTNVPIFPPGLDERGEDIAEDADITRAFVPSGDPFTEDDNLPADPIQEAITEAIITGRPDANYLNTVTPDDLSVEGSPMGGLQVGDPLSHTGARNVAGGIAGVAALPAIGAGGGMALLRALAARLGIGGGRAAAPVGRQIGTSATGRPPINVGPTKQLAGPRGSVQPPATAAAPRPPTPSPRPAAGTPGQVPATSIPRPAGTRPRMQGTLSLGGSQANMPALLEQIAARTALGGA
jgi:hypothetical protein